MPRDHQGSAFLRHIPCGNPDCGSRDGNSLYDDNHQFCFVCSTYCPPPKGEANDEEPQATRDTERRRVDGTFDRPLLQGKLEAIPNRGLTLDTCRFFDYEVGTDEQGRPCHIANYRDSTGRRVAQKIRLAGKDFSVRGDLKAGGLFGQHMFKPGDKVTRLAICEGEIDAMSLSQVLGNKSWNPVVSVPNGAQGALKAIMANIEWVSAFAEVILFMDMDAQGRSAAEAIAHKLPPGTARIAVLSVKDANEALTKGKTQELIHAYWNAPVWRPDGVVSMVSLRDAAKKPVEMGLEWCFPGLTAGTYGRRPGEVYTIGAGTGVGKTDFLTQQIEFDINTLHKDVGVFFLEQPNIETVRRIAGKADGRAYHVPDNSWTQEQYEEAVDRLADQNRLHLYNHFGQSDWEIIKARIRFMHEVLNVSLFYIDHLTALADPTKERESLETIMAEIAGMAQELGIIIHLVSHLATPEGKSHEEGGKVLLKHFKGARAIGFWTFYAFGLERDKNTQDPATKNLVRMSCLKDRGTGRFDGGSIWLKYDSATCRLTEVDPPPAPSEPKKGFGAADYESIGI